MRRLFRLTLLVAILGIFALSGSYAQVPQVTVSGRIAPGDVRVFVKDSAYIINGEYMIGGTLIIEPGTKVYFNTNGSRIIDSTGGRMIADGMANSSYTPNPNGIDPIAQPGSPSNLPGFQGYADVNYFLYNSGARTVSVNTTRDLTVHPDKYNYIVNVVLDKQNRIIKDLDPANTSALGPNDVIIPFEQAIMFYAARLSKDFASDVNINIHPWRRLGDKPVDITAGRIFFIGQQVNNFSREWGHIIVLPGARAAFFRDVTFEGFRKDTTVDRVDIYGPSMPNAAALNRAMNAITNGSGGALTTFSSRTWLLNCSFVQNMARYKGGAIQFLQSPAGFPASSLSGVGYYPVNKNPNITNKDGSLSSVVASHPIPAVDQIDEPGTTEPLSDYNRQTWDDGRLAIYLGRVRNLNLDGNYTRLSNFDQTYIGTPPVLVATDILNAPANYPQTIANTAFGGAIYMAGRDADETRQIEVGFGINNTIRNSQGLITFPTADAFVATGNTANNYQASLSSFGARGGAIYVGKYTSLIIAGKVDYNQTNAKFIEIPTIGPNAGSYSLGGAIYCENTYGRLQVRGGPDRDNIANPTEFKFNKASAGGAIYVDGNADITMSPIIGGSDATVATRDYGFNIVFENNTANAFGGAIFTRRNFTINGSGGVEANSLIGYGGKYPVVFNKNTAGYAGGAIDINIPNAYPTLPITQRNVNIIRAVFTANTVGASLTDSTNKTLVRGGGAIYSLNGDLNLVKGTEFTGNTVYNGNGGAIAMVHPSTSARRFFLTDLDQVKTDANGIVTGYTSVDSVFTFASNAYPPDARMLTRFFDNTINLDSAILASQSGSGTTQVGVGTQMTVSTLLSTFFKDANTGFAVGQNGTIIKFTQGGAQWAYKDASTNYRLTKVYFTSTSTGYIVGDRGLILKTVDNGDTWTQVNAPVLSITLNDITFVNATQGYAVGSAGTILETTDGGSTWTNIPATTITSQNLNSVYFTSLTNGFVVGDRGTIYSTTDAGATWNQGTANTVSNLNCVSFTSATTGFIVGANGVVFKSDDAGATWNSVYSDPSKTFNACYFSNSNTGYVVGDFGIIIKTVDAGKTWTTLNSSTTLSLRDVIFASDNIGFISGDYGKMLKTTNAGVDWTSVIPTNRAIVDVKRFHPGAGMAENGIGLGGAIYILDSTTTVRTGRADTVAFNRVRIQNNTAYTGSAIYSDNFGLKLLFNRSLITSNTATSAIGSLQNVITGPVVKQNNAIVNNFASSDLAPATIYGELEGPQPTVNFSAAANSIYNNAARFLIRLPDAPNTKGVLAGTTGIGFGGVDTLRGNYWGQTEANVNVILDVRPDSAVIDTSTLHGAVQETFFVAGDGATHLPFLFQPTSDPRTQGPFESIGRYSYTPIPLRNGANENTPGVNTIPEKLLMSGIIYDLYDKGTDIKTADYSKRRMSPIEDFAVGIPPTIRRYTEPAFANMPSNGKYVRRWIRDPFVAEAKDQQGNLIYPLIDSLQDEYRPDAQGNYYHPIGYPLYLEARVNYDGLADRSNHDPRLLNESVFFIINETTGDFIRSNFRQVSEDAPYRETYRARVELVPDSSNRVANTLFRRTSEGLAALGVGNELLQNLEQNPFNEDAGTLPGRRYHAATNAFGGVPTLFSNRPSMPASNNGNVTFYAGERYRALPVNVGDNVRIISRTVLWKEGRIAAFNDGISFRITNSTEPPVFTGNIVNLQTDTVIKIVPSEKPWKQALHQMDTIKMVELLNTVWVSEDREYPVPLGTYSDTTITHDAAGRDSILTVTAMDTNRFFDPRALQLPGKYSQLTYTWNVPANSGLSHWLMVDSIYASESDPNIQNPRDNALGYFIFRGRPINPFVVPGGEDVTVTASNFPPSARTIDILKSLTPPLGADTIAKFVNLFTPYFAEMTYDTINARYLQQDTINSGSNFTRTYGFRIFVTDSTPKFLDSGYVTTPNNITPLETIKKRIDRAGTEVDYVKYYPAVYTCGKTAKGKLKANVTDKLRFQADFSSDDEWEDKAVEGTWDFRYGRTAYGFVNIHIRPNDDTTVIDTTIYDKNGNGREDDSVITQTRPIWMSNQYIYGYGQETSVDPYAVDFTTRGQLNVRIDAATALNLLKPASQYAGAYNLDTVFSVVVTDGHGGKTAMDVPVFINVAPTITTQSLPNAREDVEYNITGSNNQLLDSSKMIKIIDPNFEQDHRFQLLYSDDTLTSIPKDPCFAEAGSWNVAALRTTPKWLKINPVSGMLFGKPGILDAPKDEQVTVVVWDRIDDKDEIPVVKTFTLHVDSTNHVPSLAALPVVKCIDQNSDYIDTIKVIDRDLLRANPTETLVVSVTDPAGIFQVAGSPVKGQLPSDTAKVIITKSKSVAIPSASIQNGRVTLTVRVTDAAGNSYDLHYRLRVSDATNFIATVRVENAKGAYQDLEFGTAPNATTGDGKDGEEEGHLDVQYCEYELPPLPPPDVFDARWEISTRTGILRDIFPTPKSGQKETRYYRATFQSGGVGTNTSDFYPIKISWLKSEVPAKTDLTKNPTGASWWLQDANSLGGLFNYNMNTGLGVSKGVSIADIDNSQGDRSVVTVRLVDIQGFVIFHDWTSDANDQPTNSTEITEISTIRPNPFNNGTTIKLAIANPVHVKIDVLDALGNVVAVVTNGEFEAGQPEIIWAARDMAGRELPSGSYTCRMTAGSTTSTYRMVIVK